MRCSLSDGYWVGSGVRFKLHTFLTKRKVCVQLNAYGPFVRSAGLTFVKLETFRHTNYLLWRKFPFESGALLVEDYILVRMQVYYCFVRPKHLNGGICVMLFPQILVNTYLEYLATR